MQTVGVDEEDAHIITASNVNKKLSFQGWEKCVEVFSQGKGHLSHRCSQLMPDMETSPLDQTISWSSSEDEVEDKSTHLTRPRRTLLSRINFGDCKRVRRGRRRHSSAQFVRSIEKHTKRDSSKSSEDFTSEYVENIELSRTSAHKISKQKDISVPGSELYDEDPWAFNNLSILNKRVNIFSDCTLELPSTSNLNDSEVAVPSVMSFEEKVKTSPILASRLPKNRNRKGNRTRVIAESVQVDSVSPMLSPSSPILKSTVVRRKSSIKALKCTLPTGGSSATLRPATRSEDDTETLDCVKIGDYQVNEVKPVFLSPSHQKNVIEPVVSPVIVTSLGRRRKPTGMPVNKSISPILGSKLRTTCPRKVHTALTTPNIPEGKEENCFAAEESDQGPSISDIDMLIEFLNEDIGDQSVIEHPPLKATAKRSLHFSPPTKCDKKQNHQHVSIIQDSAAAVCDRNKKHLSKHYKPQPQEIADELNQSRIIEEINTEQMDFSDFSSKLAGSPLHVQKKKKLSLKGNVEINCPSSRMSSKKLSCDTGVIDDVHINAVINDGTSQTPCRGENHNKICLPDSKSKKETKVMIHSKMQTGDKTCPNDTVFIEEESSEPMNMPSPNMFLSPRQLSNKPQMKPQTSTKKRSKPESYNEKWKKHMDCDVEIDSCSSQSSGKLKGSQSDQIERLVSPCVSTPMTISQSSSPLAPAGGVRAEGKTDDFNAPLRKGKKKLKSDGLAIRLQRLLTRERSFAHIWHFKRSKQNKTRPSPVVNLRQISSMLLTIDRTWTEYSHILLQGYVADENVRACLDSSSGRTIVVVDPTVAEKLGKLISSSQIRIFPPWQALKIRDITLILCAYCIEIVASDRTHSHLMSQRKILEESFPIKNGLECMPGMRITDIIFPTFVEKHTRLFQCSKNDISDQPSLQSDVLPSFNTISNLVSNHYTGKTSSSSLSLTVFEAFRFKQDDGLKSKGGTHSWSVLAQDTAGEVCEVVLGCEEVSPTGSKSIWEDLKSRNAIGNTYVFTGFAPIQRISPFRVSNSFRVTSNINIPGVSDQPVFYLLGALTLTWSCKYSDHRKKLCILQPQFSLLSNVAPEVPYAEPKRFNIICRVLHASHERLYIIDKSTLPQIKVVTINSMVDVPSFTFNECLVTIFHLEVDGASGLRADKYTRIALVGSKSSLFPNNTYDEKQLADLENVNLTLPPLQKTSVAKTLVTFIGTIVGVDEDSAFMWPACGVCDNELLSLRDNSKQYRCEKCNNQCENFTLRMSLQVLATSPNLSPKSSVRLKLIQRTIESLLPPSQCNEEGYDMNAVLGLELGPVACEIVHVTDSNFTLQELPGFTSHV